MNGWELLAVGLAGGAGATLRFVLDQVIRRVAARPPTATLIINVTGSLALGLIVGLATAQLISPALQLALGTGLLGGYTTFSTAAVETIRLLHERRWLAASISGLGMLIISTLAAAAGYALGLWIAG